VDGYEVIGSFDRNLFQGVFLLNAWKAQLIGIGGKRYGKCRLPLQKDEM